MNQHDISGLNESSKRRVVWILCYVVVFMATWNAVLRPSVSIPVTPYYVLMPFIAVLLAARTRWARRWFLWMIVFICYGFAVGVTYGTPLLMQAAQALKYAQLVTFFALLFWLYRTDTKAPVRLHGMVRTLTILVFSIAGIQLGTGLEFPTVVNEDSNIWLNTFFFTPNDLALFLGGVMCIVICSDAAIWKKGLFLVAFFGLNLRNDAKAVILASLLMIAMYCLVKVCIRLRIKPLVGLLILVLVVSLAVLALGDVKIKIGESEFDFMELFQDPLVRIFNLEPYNLGGSIFDRTDALIHAISALKSQSWIGLGPAGSVYTLSLPNFELLTAKSLHNAVAEVLAEFGPATLLVGFFLLKPFWKALLSIRPTQQQIAQMCLVAAAPLLSVSQSAGYISNYAFWLTVFLIWCKPARWRYTSIVSVNNDPQARSATTSAQQA